MLAVSSLRLVALLSLMSFSFATLYESPEQLPGDQSYDFVVVGGLSALLVLCWVELFDADQDDSSTWQPVLVGVSLQIVLQRIRA